MNDKKSNNPYSNIVTDLLIISGKYIFLFLFLISFSESVFADEDPGNFIEFESRFFSFSIEKQVDIKKLARRISLRNIPFQNLLNISRNLIDPRQRLAKKTEFLFIRVQNILKMFPKKMGKITIHISKDFSFLKKLIKKQQYHQKTAMYLLNDHTLYISAAHFNEYLLAHEIAHAIILHYFMIPPPLDVQEILVRHADTKLKTE